jgi:hypothetical protein
MPLLTMGGNRAAEMATPTNALTPPPAGERREREGECRKGEGSEEE